MRLCHLDLGVSMLLTCPRRSQDQLLPANVLERGVLGGAVCRWLALFACLDGAHVAVHHPPFRTSFCSDVRRLRVRVTDSVVNMGASCKVVSVT